MNASELAPSYDLVVIGGGPAGLAAASTAARAGLLTVLFDENPGVGGQIYRGITANPVKNWAMIIGRALRSRPKPRRAAP
jgi:NADPH-dependent 2,4-dienoyl-CoA reductase/sulfur reductase-like enzyme